MSMMTCRVCHEGRCPECWAVICNHEDDTGAFCRCEPPPATVADAVQILAPCPLCMELLRAWVTPRHYTATIDTRDETHRCVEQWTREQTIAFDNDCSDAFHTLQHYRNASELNMETACGASVYSVSCSSSPQHPVTCTLCEAGRTSEAS
jgi:hypothetical protein